jgi:hypothetical protein
MDFYLGTEQWKNIIIKRKLYVSKEVDLDCLVNKRLFLDWKACKDFEKQDECLTFKNRASYK